MPVVLGRALDLVDNRIAAIRGYHRGANLPRAQVDVSGGVDSAVVLALVARAVSPKNVTAVWTGIHSDPVAEKRANAAAVHARVPLISIDASAWFESIVTGVAPLIDGAASRFVPDPTILGSGRSCLRAMIGRLANRMAGGGIRHGTGNEDEDRFIRYYNKGGDGEVDTNPIAMLSKGEVYQLAYALDIPRSILVAEPSADLWADGRQSDEAELHGTTGVEWTYSRIDPAAGSYSRTGTIERFSRVDDNIPLFGHNAPDLTAVCAHPAVEGMNPVTVLRFLTAAREIERATRHKAMPHIPTLGRRANLVADGILANTLPRYAT